MNQDKTCLTIQSGQGNRMKGRGVKRAGEEIKREGGIKRGTRGTEGHNVRGGLNCPERNLS
jgi:hypothetical protein